MKNRYQEAAVHLAKALRRHGAGDDKHLWHNLELICRLMVSYFNFKF